MAKGETKKQMLARVEKGFRDMMWQYKDSMSPEQIENAINAAMKSFKQSDCVKNYKYQK